MSDTQTNKNAREPESLLTGINRSIFTKALLLSAVVHLLFLGGTSFGLYREWAEYGMFSEDFGFHTPSNLKALQRQLAREKEDETRREAEEARRDEQRARAMAEAEAEEAAAANGTRRTGRAEGGPPAEPTIEPLPPRAFSLDDVGLDL